MSEYRSLYKHQSSLSQQQSARRAILLEEQRKRRENNFSNSRDLKSTKNYKKKPYINYDFKNNLMLSEWMMEAPEDIEDFILMPCPKGKRLTLAKEEEKVCRLYYKSGQEFKFNINSNLPKNTILDCIYCDSSKTLFILDLMKYGGRDFMNCEFSFRRFWIESKFNEDDLKIHDNKDGVKLQLIETHDFCDTNSIYTCFQSHPIFENEKTELDGFLFYHKESDYTIGESPLVLWLFAFMIEDVLPMFRVHSHYKAQKPENYTNYLEYIEEFNEKLKNKRQRSRKSENSNESMDTQQTSINEEESEFDSQAEMQKMIDLEKFGDIE